MRIILRFLLKLRLKPYCRLNRLFCHGFVLLFIIFVVTGCSKATQSISSSEVVDNTFVSKFEDLESKVSFNFNKTAYPNLISKLDNQSQIIIVQRSNNDNSKSFTLLKPVNEIISADEISNSSLSASLQFNNVIRVDSIEDFESDYGIIGKRVQLFSTIRNIKTITYLFYFNDKTYALSLDNPTTLDHELIGKSFNVKR